MKYEFEEKIINKLKNELAKLTREINCSVLFMGSWRNSEITFQESGDGKSPFNDIDLLLITDQHSLKRVDVKLLRDQLSIAINPTYSSYENYASSAGGYNFYVDIRAISADQILTRNYRLKYIDIFADPKILYFNTDRFDLIIKNFRYQVEDIVAIDPLIHCLNRLCLLVEWSPKNKFPKTDNQVIGFLLKAYIAILDLVLFENRRYSPNLKEKIKYLEEICDNGLISEALCKKIKYFASFKLGRPLDSFDENLSDAIEDAGFLLDKYIFENVKRLSSNYCTGKLNLCSGLIIDEYIEREFELRFRVVPSFIQPVIVTLAKMMVWERYLLRLGVKSKFLRFIYSIKSYFRFWNDPTVVIYDLAILLNLRDNLEVELTFDQKTELNYKLAYLRRFPNITDADDTRVFIQSFRIWELVTFDEK